MCALVLSSSTQEEEDRELMVALDKYYDRAAALRVSGVEDVYSPVPFTDSPK